jgi:hypothetical protein
MATMSIIRVVREIGKIQRRHPLRAWIDRPLISPRAPRMALDDWCDMAYSSLTKCVSPSTPVDDHTAGLDDGPQVLVWLREDTDVGQRVTVDEQQVGVRARCHDAYPARPSRSAAVVVADRSTSSADCTCARMRNSWAW